MSLHLRTHTTALGLVALLSSAVACRQDMHDQPRFEAMEATDFFPDGRASRPDVPGTIARGELRLDEHLFEGIVDGAPAESFPFEITAEVMRRGQERFGIFCAPCHDSTGYGMGLVVRRGMKQPASLHVERLVQSPPGYFFEVVTKGFGAMYDLAARIPARDRWSIIAYIRALQESQRTSVADLAPGIRAELERRP